jgi:hypothetical protein
MRCQLRAIDAEAQPVQSCVREAAARHSPPWRQGRADATASLEGEVFMTNTKLSRITAITPSDSPQSVHPQLNIGAVAAVVAVMIVLALARTAEAKIVYTPTNQDLLKGQFDLDLNNDGKIDFTFTGSFASRGCGEFGNAITASLNIVPIRGNGYEGRNAAKLGTGSPIGGGRRFFARAAKMANVIQQCTHIPMFTGNWVVRGGVDGYLGLKFKIHGKDHYGWAHVKTGLTIGHYSWFSATLTGYAYETTAGKSIKAGQTKSAAEKWDEESFGTGASVVSPISESPQPASLGMLALGAQCVPLWRRKKSVADIFENK